MSSLPDTESNARIALCCLDLTSLNVADTEADVERLCRRADGPCGPVAAVCVWPRFAASARSRLPPHIAVAAVANFPAGADDVDSAVGDAAAIADAGAQEVDVVLPWRAVRSGDLAAAARLLHAVRRASAGLVLKVILETGELRDAALIGTAARLALDCGADFLKTSTGKTATSATPQAVRQLLHIVCHGAYAQRGVGVKASGGIRSVAEAGVYIELVAQALGTAALLPVRFAETPLSRRFSETPLSRRFRIGASSLLDDIEAVLGVPRGVSDAGTY